MPSSSSRTRLARTSSDSRTAWTAWWTARSARLPIQSSRSFSSLMSFSKWRSINSFPSASACSKKPREIPRFARNDGAIRKSPKASGDVSLRARIAGRGEELRRRATFDQLSVEQEGGEITDARGLLHVVRDDDDSVVLLQFDHQLFDLGRRNGVQRGSRLIHEKNLGLDSESARDAKTLLFTAGEHHGAFLEAILDDIPKRGVPERLLHALDKDGVVLHEAVDAHAEGDVVKDGLGKRIGLLKDHANAAAQADDVGLGMVNIAAIEKNFAIHAKAGDGIVHAVEGAKQRGLSAPGGADDGGNQFFAERHGDLIHGEPFPVIGVQAVHGHLCVRRSESRGGLRFDFRLQQRKFICHGGACAGRAHRAAPERTRNRARTTMATTLRRNVKPRSTRTVAYNKGLVASTSGDCVVRTKI